MAMWVGEWVFVPAVNADQAEGGLGNTARKVSAQARRGLKGYGDFRRERYALREVSQKMNPRDSFGRLQRCGKKIIFGRDVEINLAQDTGRAFFSGVETCGNVWACPVCAPKIQAKRGQEIGAAVDRAREAGYKVTMFTFTHPHYSGQGLARLIDMHNRAVKRFRAGRWFQSWKGETGFLGSISSAEVTLGENGWHWHTHVLYITEDDDFNDYILQSRWLECLRAVGFEVNGHVIKHGLDIMRNCSATEYLTKMGLRAWGAERELTGSHKKEAGKGGKTPFQILEDGDKAHWQEYVRATKGRKQIVWSKGLKAWAEVGEKTDEEIAEETDVQSMVAKVATVPVVDWWHIVRHGLRLELLEALERGGADGLREWAKEKGLMLLFSSPPWEELQDFGGVEVLEIPA